MCTASYMSLNVLVVCLCGLALMICFLVVQGLIYLPTYIPTYSIATYLDRPADLSRDIECKDRESTRQDCNRDLQLLLCWKPLPQDAPSISELMPAHCMAAPHLAPLHMLNYLLEATAALSLGLLLQG